MYHGNQSVQGGGSWNTAVLVRVYNLQHRWTDVSEYHKIFRNLRDSGRQGDRTQVPLPKTHIYKTQIYREIVEAEVRNLKVLQNSSVIIVLEFRGRIVR